MTRLSEKALLYNAVFQVYWNGLTAPTIYAKNLNIGALKGCPWVRKEHDGEVFWYRRHQHGLIQLLRELRKKSGGVMYTIDGDPVYATIATSGDWMAMHPDVPVVPVNVSGINFLLEVLQLNPYLGNWKVVKTWIEGQPKTAEYAVPRVVKTPMAPDFETWAKYIQHWVWEDYHAVDGLPNSSPPAGDSPVPSDNNGGTTINCTVTHNLSFKST